MKTENFKFKSSDGTNIFVNKWSLEEDAKPKGVIQIAHGMAEHSYRYSGFAQALTSDGFAVYANDHRGHGKTAASEDIGYFSDENGWNLVVEDMHTLTNIIKRENPNVPVFLLGHSMGSFLSRTYIQQYSKDTAGVILCGTGGDLGLLGNIGMLIAKREIKRIGKRARSKRMDKLSFGNFNKAFKPNRTNFDWLSRDNKEVDKYIKDPLCGEVFTAGFFYDMLGGLKELMKKENIEKIRKELPIYLISGEKDPVGKNTKGVLQAYESYNKAGIKDISYKFYTDARHEILNETNKEEVYKDIIIWLNEH
jgi:alpha-beta hydrolase superfamily lysophospholipase